MSKFFLNKHTSSPVGSDKSVSFGREDPGMKVRQVWRSWSNPLPPLQLPTPPSTIPSCFPRPRGSTPRLGHWFILKDSPSQQCRRTQDA